MSRRRSSFAGHYTASRLSFFVLLTRYLSNLNLNFVKYLKPQLTLIYNIYKKKLCTNLMFLHLYGLSPRAPLFAFFSVGSVIFLIPFYRRFIQLLYFSNSEWYELFSTRRSPATPFCLTQYRLTIGTSSIGSSFLYREFMTRSQ